MKVLWEYGTLSAKDISAILAERLGWKKTTSYTMLGRCVDKGYLLREEPSFMCTALLTKQAVAESETDDLLSNDFDDSAEALITSLLKRNKLTADELEALAASFRAGV